MANRSDRDPPSLNRWSGSEPLGGNEARVGRFHQGQRAEIPAQQAGYKTAIYLTVTPISLLASREASIQPTMARKRYRPDEIVNLLRQAEVLHGQGRSMADAIRQLGISEVTSYLYGRLSRCKRCCDKQRGSVANIYPASPMSACPNGESARTRLYRW